ncbi:MAG: hypothetical protein JXR95_13100 [Deltaproteobacteria bacterium]|nr:hypothetical protein [Deltaproteobacteria bacterium]
MRNKLFFAALLVVPFIFAGCWTGSCEEVQCSYCDSTGCYEEQEDGSCEPAWCWTNEDCWADEYCNTDLNQCFPDDIECFFDWECPESMICENWYDGTGYCANPNQDNVCRSDWDCPEDGYCDEFTGSCIQTDGCDTSADCPDGFYCDSRNVCSPRPTGDCVNDDNCGQGSYCEEGTCVNSTICTDSTQCLDSEAPVCDERGVCIPEREDPIVVCTNNIDCGEGKVCIDGICENEAPRDPSQNCLINEHCGENGVCINGECHAPCVSADDCGTGQLCSDTGICVDDANPGTECVANTDCSDSTDICMDGVCHDQCTVDADCTNSADRCADGMCIPNDVARPMCYTNNECNGGEECVDGVCRVPCVDSEDCEGCPGNPICGDFGYCVDNNDINPECSIENDCENGMICMDAMCVAP